MNKPEFRKFKPFLLILILISAFLLYIKEFLPFESVDETMIAGFVWGLHDSPFPVNLYPPFFLYIHFLLSLLYKSILIFLGVIHGSSKFMSTIGLSFTVEAGRVLNALLATALVYLVYRMGRKFYNKSVAFFAALLMAFNHLIILHAHIFKSDILVSLLITLSLYLLFKYLNSLNMKFIYFSAYLFGLSVAAKYNVYIFAPVILLALFLTRKEIGNLKMIRVVIALPMVMAAGFFTGAPNWLIHPLGNIRLFLEKYGFGSQSVFEPYRLYSPPQIYIKFILNWISDFGWIFVLFFLIAIPISFLSKAKKEILLVTFILIYVILFGFMGFYGDRFCLPLYSSISILIGKTIFVDFKTLCRRRKKTWAILATMIWIGTSLFILFNIKSNLTTFNLIKTKSKDNWAKDYRSQHNLHPDRFNIAFQHLTPRIKGGIKLNASYQLRWFKRHQHKRPHFIQAVHKKYSEFIKTYSKEESNLTIDFSRFKPFYLIQKPKVQPWDNDFLFLYRVPKNLSAIQKTHSILKIAMPRSFTMNPHTSYFPLQLYEKHPGFGKTINGEYQHYLYSKQKVTKINIYVFNPHKRFDLSIRINHLNRRLKRKNTRAVEHLKIKNIKPKKLFSDHVYLIKIQKNPGHEPYYCVFWPEFLESRNQLTEIKKLAIMPPDEKIPPLFSRGLYPRWFRDFYQKTDIDLSLLAFINRVELFHNQNESLQDIKIDYFPLQPGFYTLTINGSGILDIPHGNTYGFLEYNLFSSRGNEEQHTVLNGENTTIKLDIKKTIHFMGIELKGLRQNNFLVRQITIQPDYLGFIESKISDPVKKLTKTARQKILNPE
ncbi:MAG: glycosyltransferase family 39 protein [Candidatus Aminicenantes bacterium]|nr:glycosyltransferase family 39 protein [Candidatus Aminicenantes bacterium]